ncbi:unnamed protein product [Pleuronectes platessa]|uniref:Uncharacterized protein n=1 Tax=Pleuronectes platessa TaxID=8262 RepID=A0A9N7Y6C8_PLEPL|nr:unnamed protein product [Pleuronectes platessa]
MCVHSSSRSPTAGRCQSVSLLVRSLSAFVPIWLQREGTRAKECLAAGTYREPNCQLSLDIERRGKERRGEEGKRRGEEEKRRVEEEERRGREEERRGGEEEGRGRGEEI